MREREGKKIIKNLFSRPKHRPEPPDLRCGGGQAGEHNRQYVKPEKQSERFTYCLLCRTRLPDGAAETSRTEKKDNTFPNEKRGKGKKIQTIYHCPTFRKPTPFVKHRKDSGNLQLHRDSRYKDQAVYKAHWDQTQHLSES